MKSFRSILWPVLLVAVGTWLLSPASLAQQPKNVQKNAAGSLTESFNSAQTHIFLSGANVTFAANSTLSIVGTLNINPTTGTWNLGNVTVLGLPGGGDAVTTGTLDQFANVTQTAGVALAITGNTTLGGGSHSGTNTGDQNIVLSGAISGSGTGNIVTTMANTTVTPATYGNATHVGQFQVTSDGRLVAAQNVAITGGSGNVIQGATFAANQLLYVSNATTGEISGIAGATYNSGNNTITFNGTVAANALSPTAVSGATANGEFLIGNVTSGNFEKATITQGAGITLTPSAGGLTIAANATGTNTGDQNIIFGVAVAGQNNITANSTSTMLTVAGTGGVVVTTNNTTGTLTIDGGNITGGGSAETGDIKFILDSASVPSGWALTGANGIPAITSPDADAKAVIKMAGTVATPTFSPVAGAVASGTTITFSSATSGVTFMTTNNTTDPSRSVGTAGGTWVISANQTIEVMAYKDGAYLIDSAVASAAYTVTGGSDPDLWWLKLNESGGSTAVADVGPNASTDATLASGYADLDGTNDITAVSNIAYGVSTITVSMWVNMDDITGTERNVFNTQSGGNYVDKSLAIYSESSTFYVNLWGTSYTTFQKNYPVTTGGWRHIAVVADNSSTGALTFYIDGTVSAGTGPSPNNKDTSGNFATGAPKIGGASANYDGLIDDVRIYGSALDATAIAAIYAAGRQ